MTYKRAFVVLALLLTLTVPIGVQVQAQTVTDDDTTLKQIILFGRHSIRSGTVSPEDLAKYAIEPYPNFDVSPGCLTPNGKKAEKLLGTYFRQYLLHEGLLTGNNQKDASRSYFRSNSIERSWMTAKFFGSGLVPKVTVPVHSFDIGVTDPVFDPTAAGVAEVDAKAAALQIQKISNSGAVLASAYSGEYSLISHVLFNGKPVPSGKVDPTTLPITFTPNPSSKPLTGGVVDLGGLQTTEDAIDPFVMQYCNNFDMSDVGWGRLTPDQLSQDTRITVLKFSLGVRTPYLAQVQSSNAASHILRTLEQGRSGTAVPGAFGGARSRIVVVISSDTYVAGLGGLLNVHWQLPGYQQDFCAPGGALVFELRQVNKTKKYIVRVFYTAQTFDQLRNLTRLSLAEPPATIQLLIPGVAKSPTNLDIDYGVFKNYLTDIIGRQYVENPSKEVHPPVLNGVTCQ